MPKMTHPDSKQTIDVSPEQVGLYTTQGWVEKQAPPAKKQPAPKSSSK